MSEYTKQVVQHLEQELLAARAEITALNATMDELHEGILKNALANEREKNLARIDSALSALQWAEECMIPTDEAYRLTLKEWIEGLSDQKEKL